MVTDGKRHTGGCTMSVLETAARTGADIVHAAVVSSSAVSADAAPAIDSNRGRRVIRRMRRSRSDGRSTNATCAMRLGVVRS